ncbi:MAG: SAM-dependent methyltransferase, partial [Candidatus Phytoplasma australasiaticum]|nr:SAM-dependent methyltransferase [Candidatus Phytoplasma australasiaticum]
MFYNLKIKYLKNMKKYAIQENIPIIPEETGIFLENFINTKKIVDILEIGTAVGYSALTMCNPTNRIQTLERSKIYYQLAKKIFSHTP